MSRKVYVDVEGTVLVPVQFRGKLIVTMDDDEHSIEDALSMFAHGVDGEIANTEILEMEIVKVGEAAPDFADMSAIDPVEINIEQYIGDRTNITSHKVMDSK